jgi:hypothetical protein
LFCVLVVGVGLAGVLWWFGVDHGVALRCGIVASVATMVVLLAMFVDLLASRLAQRLRARWWLRREWELECTLTAITVLFTRRRWRDELPQLANRLAGLADLLPVMQHEHATRTWDARKVDWARRGAASEAQRMLHAAIEASWRVKHGDRVLPPMPRVLDGGRTARGVTLEVEWPGGGHPGLLDDALLAGLRSYFHLPHHAGALVVDVGGRPGNRAGLFFNYGDPFPTASAEPPFVDEDLDASA